MEVQEKKRLDINDAGCTTERLKEWRICKIHVGDCSKGKMQYEICICQTQRASDE